MGIPLVPLDTTLVAARVQLETYRRMAPERRLELAFEMSNTLREIVAAGVRARHPEFDDERVRLAVCRLTWGDELFREVYPGVDVAV